MQVYLDLLKKVFEGGVDRPDRTGTGTRALFGAQMRFNMKDGFPAVTTKKLAFKAVKSELLWFLEGSSDNNRLKELSGTNETIWSANAEAPYWKKFAAHPGDLGRIYGVQWRKWQGTDGKPIDQLLNVIHRIKDREESFKRRLIVTAWHPSELDYQEQEVPRAALSPCHIMFQFFVVDDMLSLQMYQRSCDMFLGVPFNIASYALLLHMVAQVTGLKAHEFIHTLGDIHIYHNHFEAVQEQLKREPLPLPTLWLNPDRKDIDTFTMDDIRLDAYEFHSPIKASMAV